MTCPDITLLLGLNFAALTSSRPVAKVASTQVARAVLSVIVEERRARSKCFSWFSREPLGGWEYDRNTTARALSAEQSGGAHSATIIFLVREAVRLAYGADADVVIDELAAGEPESTRMEDVSA
jgi:hypothetical protein